MAQERFDEHSRVEMLTWLHIPDLSPMGTSVGCSGQTGLIHEGPSSQFTGLKGSAAVIFVPDSTAHLQGSGGVQVWTAYAYV